MSFIYSLLSRRHPVLEEGSKAPDFKVQDHTGKTVKLSDFKGKSVLLWFYPMADTPG